MNVVKVGHRQVVNMIRQGGNSLMMKVVMVTRNPELEEVPKKKGQRSYIVLKSCSLQHVLFLSFTNLFIKLHFLL